MSAQEDLAGQVVKMLADIESFLTGTVPIDRLSVELKMSLAVMEGRGADPKWLDELRSLRNEIEYINAFWLDSGRSELNADEARVASEAASELQAALTISTRWSSDRGIAGGVLDFSAALKRGGL